MARRAGSWVAEVDWLVALVVNAVVVGLGAWRLGRRRGHPPTGRA